MAPKPEEAKSKVSLNNGAKAATGKVVDCPHCGEEVLVHFSVDICKVEQNPSTGPLPVAPVDRWRKTLSMQQIAILDAAKRSGLLEAFEFTVRNIANCRPKHVEKAFLDWFKFCRPRTIPAWAMNEFRQLYPGKRIEFHAHGHIGAVVAGEVVSLFVPMEVIAGTNVEMELSGEQKVIPGDVKGVQQWIRTRMGYVPVGANVVINVMRRRCIGEFARPLI